ncbi:MAG: 1-acyl-sn-glycerol-3-phosphate acyltransferase [Acidobacteriota bacterium]
MTRTVRLLRWLDRLLLRLFFRRIEVEGADVLLDDRPRVLIANHVSALVDAMVLFGTLPRIPRFLGKSTLWNIALLRPLLNGARVIPIYRRQDQVDMSRNADTFARCHEVLAEGGTVALFPEGTSHNEPALLPLKTGAARIVLAAEEKFGPLDLRVVPIGLIFDNKGKFRSRLLVRVGEEIDPLAIVADQADDRAAVAALTETLSRGLAEVTLNFDSWDQAQRIARAVEIFERRDPDLPQGSELGRTFAARRAFLSGYRKLVERYPERVAEVETAVAGYQALLEESGLRDRQVAARYPLPSVSRHLLRSAFRMLVRLPVAMVGTLLNGLPYLAVSMIASRKSDEDQLATYKIFPALLVYPIAWLIEAAAAGFLWNGWAALGVALLAPLTGPGALRFHDDRTRLLSETRAFLKLGTRRGLADELRHRRGQVRQKVAEAVELYRAVYELET